MAVCLFSWLQPTSLFLLRHFSYLFLNNLVFLWCIRWASEQLPGAPWSIWGQSKEQAGLNVRVSLNRLTCRAQWPVQHLHCQVAVFITPSPEHCGGLTLASCFPTPWERDPIAAVCWVPDGCQRVDLSAGLGNWVVPTLKDQPPQGTIASEGKVRGFLGGSGQLIFGKLRLMNTVPVLGQLCLWPLPFRAVFCSIHPDA